MFLFRGSAIARIIGANTAKYKDYFEETVKAWVFEEKVDGENLTDIINKKHENVKYLPGVEIPTNVVCSFYFLELPCVLLYALLTILNDLIFFFTSVKRYCAKK